MELILLLTLGGFAASALLLLRLARLSRKPLPPPKIKIKSAKVVAGYDPEKARRSVRRGRITAPFHDAHAEGKRLKRELEAEIHASED